MQKLTNAETMNINELQTSNDIPLREKKAREYIIKSFTGKMPSLIPFALNNKSIVKLASNLLKYTTGSKHTLYQYVFGIYRFSKWINKSPDKIIQENKPNTKAIDEYIQRIDDFIGDLQAQEKAPGSINNHVKGVKALFRVNRVKLALPFRVPKTVKFPDRAPTPEELSMLIVIADLQEKVIVSILALSGVRVGTLVKLQYRHVKHDLENDIIPIHIHVEAEITKGKYNSYDTFIGFEGVKYLKAYINARKIGSQRIEGGKIRGIPPENITDVSPLIRNEHKSTVEPIIPATISYIIHKLFVKSGIIKTKGKTRYKLRAHSIRKYFRTQLGAISTIPTDYIEYMMGHKISTYNDIKMKGIDFLRGLYASSGLSIRPKTKLSKVEQLKMFAQSLGLNPDEVLSKNAITRPHRTIIDPEQNKIEILNQALKEAIIMELKR